MISVCDNPLSQPIGSEVDEPPEPRGAEAMAPIDISYSSFRQATLKSERIRIIGLILVLAFILMVIVIRALFGGVPEQFHLLPRFTALILASAAYESLMLGLVSRAIKRGSDLPLWAWSANTGIEALIPTFTLLLLTESPFMGPYRALSAPATHGYYIFIILSTLRLRPGLCFLTGLASALGFAAVAVYTFVVYPAGSGSDRQIYPLQVYATYGILLPDLWHDRGVALRPVSPARHGRPSRGRDPRSVRAAGERDRPARAGRAGAASLGESLPAAHGRDTRRHRGCRPAGSHHALQPRCPGDLRLLGA